MFCSSCGKQLKENDRFCSGCGKIVEKEESIVQENIIQDNNKVIEKIDNIPQIKEKSTLRKEYFKWLIIITLVFGLLEVLLVFLMPFGEIHAKVLATIGLIVLFGLIGLLLIGLYENTNENKFPFAGIGVNVACFILSALLIWEILSGDFITKTMGCLVILLAGLIIISSLFTVFSSSKYMDYSRKITNGVILSAVALFSLGIYNDDLFEVDIFVRGIWAICILIALGLFVTLLLSKMFSVPESSQSVKKRV